MDEQVVGCAYIHLQPNSGYIFNVNVNSPYRRRGVAQELMAKLEQLTWLNGRQWTCLQVDSDNLAARNLYEKLGYWPYNAFFLRSESSPLEWETEPVNVQLQRIRPYSGRNLFNRYLDHEKKNGELVDAAVINDYDSGNISGDEYWRCLLDGQEIGAIISRGTEIGPIFQLAFDQSAWGQTTYSAIIRLLILKLAIKPQRVDLVFGSSGHFDRAKDMLTQFGFRAKHQTRLLMFKSLSREDSAA